MDHIPLYSEAEIRTALKAVPNALSTSERAKYINAIVNALEAAHILPEGKPYPYPPSGPSEYGFTQSTGTAGTIQEGT